MADRYFLESPITDGRATLAGSEAHHLLHVMRVKAGELITLFDGTGREFDARVLSTGRSTIDLEVLAEVEIDREAGIAVTLAVALPKGDRQKFLIEKAVELGVARLVPLTTARGVAQPSEGALERLQRSVIEASKQCGRNRLMEIAEPRTLITAATHLSADVPRWIAHPGGASLATMSARLVIEPRPREVWFAIGPEGGFSDEEVSSATQKGWQPLDLGPRILRVETAALLLAGLATSVEPKS